MEPGLENAIHVDASVINWHDLSLAVQFNTMHLLPSLSGCFWGMLAASLPPLSVLPPKWFLFTPFTALLTRSALQSPVAPGTAHTLAGGRPTNGIIIFPLQLKMALSI